MVTACTIYYCHHQQRQQQQQLLCPCLEARGIAFTVLQVTAPKPKRFGINECIQAQDRACERNFCGGMTAHDSCQFTLSCEYVGLRCLSACPGLQGAGTAGPWVSPVGSQQNMRDGKLTPGFLSQPQGRQGCVNSVFLPHSK